jgi:hypothetical protein
MKLSDLCAVRLKVKVMFFLVLIKHYVTKKNMQQHKYSATP